MNRISKTKFILWTILGIAAAVGVTRFIYGLGVTTNLTDSTPWGFWIGFDVMGGVALAAGGFVIAGINYIFGKKEFRPIARAAILTAFLGYLAVAIGLLFDLGLPWNIWHMVIFWNPHSPLFEVGWCVMLYLGVLTLEFSPVVLEKYPNIPFLAKIHKFLYKIRIPLVVLGIMLSTLHQSSLGSLALAWPYKLHPLWYSPIIPVIFFVSAIYLGLMMVMVESMTSSYVYNKEPETDILKKLKKFAFSMLGIYVLLRFADILIRGAGSFLFEETWAAFLFWMEIGISVFIPLIIFIIPRLTSSINALYFASLAGVIGIVFNRLNVAGLTHLDNLSNIGDFYFPSWMELSISAGVVSVAMLVFFFFIENFKVWEEQPKDVYDDPKNKVRFGFNKTYFGPLNSANRTRFSLAFVLAFSLGFALISGGRLYSEGISNIQVTKARGGDTLFVDGNRNGYGVEFPHKAHEDKQIKCSSCHHLNAPNDEATGCYECHYNMYAESDAFNHDWHSSSGGANLNCFECHGKDENKGNSFRNKLEFTSELCVKCHEDIIPPDTDTEIIKTYHTLSYTDALHTQCISCHEDSLAVDPGLKDRLPDLAKCANCHDETEQEMKNKKLFIKRYNNKWVVVPSKIRSK
ncbi:NrfD/PsrC family molybdoenzyme membrane anchor subunit [Bacteroidota bacterium]